MNQRDTARHVGPHLYSPKDSLFDTMLRQWTDATLMATVSIIHNTFNNLLLKF